MLFIFIISSVLTLLWLLIARVVLAFACYFPFTNTMSTDKTYSNEGSKGGLDSSKRKDYKFISWPHVKFLAGSC